jgi:uncharacterized protein YndB with AHSA1/START domain
MLEIAILPFLGVCGCATVVPPQAREPIPLDGTARVLEGERYLEYRVGANIQAEPEEIWALITDAAAYPRWNSTVIAIEGTIAADETIELTAKIDPDRTFDLKVSTFEPGSKLVWEDGGKAFKGVRTFTLTPRGDGSTDFTMAEVLTGALLPMIEKKLPDFRPSFDAFAADLERAAESR